MEIDEVEPNLSLNMSVSAEQSSSLASLLGGQSLVHLGKRPVIPVTVEWAEGRKDGSKSHTDEKEHLVQEMLDPTKVQTVSQFEEVCQAFIKKCRSKSAVSKASLASLVLNSVADRNADKNHKKFWPQKLLLKMIKECNVAASSCLPFVLLAIKMDDVDVVKKCVDCMQDIPDSTLVKCLQFYIRHFQGATSEVQNSPETDSPSPSVVCPVTSECAQCFNKVLCCPFNDTFIIDNLRQFSFDEAMVLLRYLHFLLASMSAIVQDDCVPNLDIVADWISALLDAHFTQLILSSEARALLAELAQSVHLQEEFYTELEAVKTILQSFRSSQPVSAQQTGHYSIEVMSMVVGHQSAHI